MHSPFNRSARSAAVLALLAGVAAGLDVRALAQPAGGDAAPAAHAAPDKELASSLSDFVHYIRIARYDLAKGFAASLLDKMAKPIGNAEADKATLSFADFAALVDSGNEATRFAETVQRGTRVAELEGAADRLIKAYEQGKLEQARNPQEIDQNIERLTGDQRQRMYARERLMFAGEYAMPKLLKALQGGDNPARQAEVRQLLVDMGRPALMPMAVALPDLDPVMQEQVAGIMGAMPYRTSLPFLYDLYSISTNPTVKSAAEKAIRQIDGSFSADANPASLLAMLAESYYQKNESLLLLPKEATQPVWTYSAKTGLNASSVLTPVFHDMMAMRLAERALSRDASRADAVATWLAANFSREILSPKDYDNPLWPKDKPDAMYYAVAAGPSAAQAVLAKALDQKNTGIARRAISAIERTAGSSSLAGASVDGRRPLLEALKYPSRRVQYEAALALAAGNPPSTFEGAHRVVPILASAVRDADAKFAGVIAPDAEMGALAISHLKAKGYTTLPVAAGAGDLINAAADLPGLDLIIVAMPGRSTADARSAIRSDSRLTATPIVGVLSAQAELDAGLDTMRDPLFKAVREGSAPEQMAAQIDAFVALTGSGPLSADETTAYKLRALSALRDLAMSGSAAMSAADAVAPLVSALGDAKGEVRLAIADVLTMIPDKRGHEAVADVAIDLLGADAAAAVPYLNRAAAGARKHGNLLEDRQTQRLVELAGTTKGEPGTALAALVGALDLPNRSIVPLIVGGK